MKLKLLLASVSLALLAPFSLSAVLLFEDNFGQGAGSLDGATPDGSGSLSGTWSAPPEVLITSEGRLGQDPNLVEPSGFGFFHIGDAITPGPGVIVTVTVDIFRPEGEHANWMGLGFTNSDDVGTSSPPFGNTEGGPWFRFSQEDDGMAWIHGGEAANNSRAIGGFSPDLGTTRVSLELDTDTLDYVLTNETTQESVFGTLEPTHTPEYNYLFVRWHRSGEDRMEFEKIAVSAIPEPSTYALLGGLLAFAGVLMARRFRCS